MRRFALASAVLLLTIAACGERNTADAPATALTDFNQPLPITTIVPLTSTSTLAGAAIPTMTAPSTSPSTAVGTEASTTAVPTAGQTPSETVVEMTLPDRHGASSTVCLLTDPAGPSDLGLNSGALAGLQRAKRNLDVETQIVDNATIDDIAVNLGILVTSGACDLIIGIGYLAATAIDPLVAAYPDQKFAVIDAIPAGSEYPPPNLRGVIFRENEAGFLVGYVAAWVCEHDFDCDTVATYGGAPVRSVEQIMTGYYLGVDHFNQQSQVSAEPVEVLGWDPHTKTGDFTFTFTSPEAGYTMGEALMDAGASVVFPVAGGTGIGTMWAIRDRRAAGDPQLRFFIGADGDWAEMAEGYGVPEEVVLTSALKDTDRAVYHQVEALVSGAFTGSFDIEGLLSGGVDIAGYDQMAQDLKDELAAIREGIIDGSICTTIPCSDG